MINPEVEKSKIVAQNVRVLGEEADKRDHIPDVSKMVASTKQTLN